MKILRNNVVCIFKNNTLYVYAPSWKTALLKCRVMQFYFVFRFKYSLRAKEAMETTAARRALM